MQTRIKDLRKQKNMSQLTLAVKIGCSQNTISKIEKGEADPRASLLIEMAEHFGVSVDYMLRLSEQKTTMKKKDRMTRLVNQSWGYMEKYESLSEESKWTVNAVADRRWELEKLPR